MPTARLVSLCALCIHYSFLTIVMHLSRTHGKTSYKPSSAVVVTEFCKLLLSLVLALREALQERAQRQARPSPFSRFEPQFSSLTEEPSSEEEGEPRWTDETEELLADAMTPMEDLAQATGARERTTSAELHLNPGRRRRLTNTATLDHVRSTSYSHRLSVQPSPDPGAGWVDPGWTWAGLLAELWTSVFSPGWWRLGVPAVMFVVQNNLQYVAASNLSVPLFQITYQLKILTTALCSVLLLNRRLRKSQWTALVILGVGVAAVQLHAQAEDREPGQSSAGYEARRAATNSAKHMNQLLGLVAVVCACLSSGFASVYFERVLKSGGTKARQEGAGAQTPRQVSASPGGNQQTGGQAGTIWVRNIQLSLFGILVGLGVVLVDGHGGRLPGRWNDSLWWWESLDRVPRSFASKTFFAGFSPLVWLVVALQVLGGLLNALVIQHADNIAKGFATSLSIILSFAASTILFDFKLSLGSLIGSALVIGATWLFNCSQDQVTRLVKLDFSSHH